MADNSKISAELRTSFGKGSSRQLRRDGRVPAVVYGHGADSLHLSLDSHDVFLATKGQANAVLTVSVDGEEILALVKELQRNPLSRQIEHLDLLRVAKGEKVEVEVPVVTIGESASGTIHQVELMTVLVKASATAIPETIEVDVTGLAEGEHVTVADLKLPEGSEVDLDPEAIVVVISAPEAEEAPAVEAAE